MFRKPIFLLMLSCAAFSSGANSSFAQTKPVDKTVLARFEKSVASGKTEEIEQSLLDFAVANPSNPKVLELLAAVRFRQNRLSEAAALYRRVLSLDASSATAKINLARIFDASAQLEEARRMLDEINETSVSDAAIRLNLAAAFLQVGEAQKALDTAEKLPLKIKNSDALPIIAASYAALKNEVNLRGLLPLMKRAATNPSLALACAEALRNAGLNQEAADLLRSALATASNNFDTLIALVRFEIGAKDFVSAQKHLNQAAKLQPRSAKLYFAQGVFEESQSNSKAALELLTQARLIEPNSAEILSQFVITAMRANQSKAAVEAAQILAKSKPDEPEYLYLLGASSLQQGSISQAQTSLERLMELRPNDSRGCLALGLTLAAQSDKLESARTQLLQCIEIDANNVEAKYQLGLSYKTQGETAKAIQFFEETVKTAPNYAPALRDLGASYLQIGAEEKARIALEKAVALAPDDADTHFQLSRLYNLIGETALAKKHLELFQTLKNAPVK